MKSRQNYYNNMCFETWMNNRNPDNVDYDKAMEYRDDGYSPDDAAQHELYIERCRRLNG